MFQNMVLRRMLRKVRGRKQKEREENCGIRNFQICTFHTILLIDETEESEPGRARSTRGRDKYIQHYKGQCDWEMILSWILNKWGVRVWIKQMCFRISRLRVPQN
jgi:hypothetical protein